MDRIASFIVHRSKVVLGVTAVLTLTAVGSMFMLRFNADVGGFITEGNEAGEAWVALQEKYDTSDPINVLAETPEGTSFRSLNGLISIVALRERIADVDGVASVGAPVPEDLPVGGAMPSEEEILALLDANPLADLLISDDGRYAMLMVVPEDDGIGVAGSLADLEAPMGMDLTLSGNPVIYSSVLDNLSWFCLLYTSPSPRDLN